MIKAIETHYKGYRFRSRLEARWAVFFDALGIKWEYEKEGFKLGGGVNYLPDFWLPDFRVWAEIKSNAVTMDEIRKCELFRNNDQAIVLCVGLPGENYSRLFCYDLTDSSAGSSDFYCQFIIDTDEQPYISVRDSRDRNYFSSGIFDNESRLKNIYPNFPEKYRNEGIYILAITAAKSARFEFGE